MARTFNLATLTRCDGSAGPAVERSREDTAFRFRPGDSTSYEVIALPKTNNYHEDSALAFVGDAYGAGAGILYIRGNGVRKIGKPSKYDLAVLPYLAQLALGYTEEEPAELASRRTVSRPRPAAPATPRDAIDEARR